MKAYNGDEIFRAAFIGEMKWHASQDKLIKGTYGEGDNGDFRGCAVGCGVHSLARLRGENLDPSSHSLLATALDIPVELEHLQDALFEALPQAEAMAFPVRFAEAIKTGADLSRVIPAWLYWMLADPVDGVIRFAPVGEWPKQHAVIMQVADLWKREAEGERISAATWDAMSAATRDATSAAARAATSAAAWDAARAAARDAARAAAWAAAWAATSAATRDAISAATRYAMSAATRDATSVATRDATSAAAIIRMANKLIALMEAA